MTCQGCVRSIEAKLSGIDGVTYTHVNLGEGSATVEFDDSLTNVAKLASALDEIGFAAVQS